MKLAISALELFIRVGYNDALKLIKEAGFDCVDFGFGKFGESFDFLADNYVDRAKEMRALLDELSLECHQIHTPYAMLYGEKLDTSMTNYLNIVRSFEFASILGAEYAVVHPIVVDKETGASEWEHNKKFYKSLEPYADRFGIKIAVENMFHTDSKRNRLQGRLNTPEELCGFIHELDSPNFVACFDAGHAALTGLDPEDFLAGMEKGLIKVVHLHDNNFKGDDHSLPYLGKINWGGVMKELRRLEYDGDLNLEIFRYVRRVPIDFLDETLAFAVKAARRLEKEFYN